MKNSNALITRWSETIDHRFNRSLRGVNWKDKSTPNAKLTEPPFGLTPEGKIDLRCLPLREGLKYQYFLGVDFSGFEFKTRTPDEVRNRTGYIGDGKGGQGIQDSLFENCAFSYAKLPNMSGQFSHCTFNASAIIGKRISGTFSHYQFDEAVFDDVIFGDVAI